MSAIHQPFTHDWQQSLLWQRPPAWFLVLRSLKVMCTPRDLILQLTPTYSSYSNSNTVSPITENCLWWGAFCFHRILQITLPIYWSRLNIKLAKNWSPLFGIEILWVFLNISFFMPGQKRKNTDMYSLWKNETFLIPKMTHSSFATCLTETHCCGLQL